MDDRVYPPTKPPLEPWAYGGFDYLNPAGNKPKYPPPPPHPPPLIYYQSSRRRSRLRFCCAFFVGLISAFCIATLLIYFLVRPRVPKYTLQDANVKQFNLTDHALTSDMVFTVKARNPNRKIGLYYDDVNVVASYEGAQIGEGSIAPFYQGHKNTSVLLLHIVGRDVALGEDVGDNLKGLLVDNKGSLSLQINTIARVRIKVGLWESWRTTIRVACDVNFSSPLHQGKTQIVNKKCRLIKEL